MYVRGALDMDILHREADELIFVRDDNQNPAIETIPHFSRQTANSNLYSEQYQQLLEENLKRQNQSIDPITTVADQPAFDECLSMSSTSTPLPPIIATTNTIIGNNSSGFQMTNGINSLNDTTMLCNTSQQQNQQLHFQQQQQHHQQLLLAANAMNNCATTIAPSASLPATFQYCDRQQQLINHDNESTSSAITTQANMMYNFYENQFNPMDAAIGIENSLINNTTHHNHDGQQQNQHLKSGELSRPLSIISPLQQQQQQQQPTLQKPTILSNIILTPSASSSSSMIQQSTTSSSAASVVLTPVSADVVSQICMQSSINACSKLSLEQQQQQPPQQSPLPPQSSSSSLSSTAITLPLLSATLPANNIQDESIGMLTASQETNLIKEIDEILSKCQANSNNIDAEPIVALIDDIANIDRAFNNDTNTSNNDNNDNDQKNNTHNHIPIQPVMDINNHIVNTDNSNFIVCNNDNVICDGDNITTATTNTIGNTDILENVNTNLDVTCDSPFSMNNYMQFNKPQSDSHQSQNATNLSSAIVSNHDDVVHDEVCDLDKISHVNFSKDTQENVTNSCIDGGKSNRIANKVMTPKHYNNNDNDDNDNDDPSSSGSSSSSSSSSSSGSSSSSSSSDSESDSDNDQKCDNKEKCANNNNKNKKFKQKTSISSNDDHDSDGTFVSVNGNSDDFNDFSDDNDNNTNKKSPNVDRNKPVKSLTNEIVSNDIQQNELSTTDKLNIKPDVKTFLKNKIIRNLKVKVKKMKSNDVKRHINVKDRLKKKLINRNKIYKTPEIVDSDSTDTDDDDGDIDDDNDANNTDNTYNNNEDGAKKHKIIRKKRSREEMLLSTFSDNSEDDPTFEIDSSIYNKRSKYPKVYRKESDNFKNNNNRHDDDDDDDDDEYEDEDSTSGFDEFTGENVTLRRSLRKISEHNNNVIIIDSDIDNDSNDDDDDDIAVVPKQSYPSNKSIYVDDVGFKLKDRKTGKIYKRYEMRKRLREMKFKSRKHILSLRLNLELYSPDAYPKSDPKDKLVFNLPKILKENEASIKALFKSCYSVDRYQPIHLLPNDAANRPPIPISKVILDDHNTISDLSNFQKYPTKSIIYPTNYDLIPMSDLCKNKTELKEMPKFQPSYLGDVLYRLSNQYFYNQVYVKFNLNCIDKTLIEYPFVYGAIPSVYADCAYYFLTLYVQYQKDYQITLDNDIEVAKKYSKSELERMRDYIKAPMYAGELETMCYIYWNLESNDLHNYDEYKNRPSLKNLLNYCISRVKKLSDEPTDLHVRLHTTALPKTQYITKYCVLTIKWLLHLIVHNLISKDPNQLKIDLFLWQILLKRLNVHHYLCRHTQIEIKNTLNNTYYYLYSKLDYLVQPIDRYTEILHLNEKQMLDLALKCIPRLRPQYPNLRISDKLAQSLNGAFVYLCRSFANYLSRTSINEDNRCVKIQSVDSFFSILPKSIHTEYRPALSNPLELVDSAKRAIAAHLNVTRSIDGVTFEKEFDSVFLYCLHSVFLYIFEPLLQIDDYRKYCDYRNTLLFEQYSANPSQDKPLVYRINSLIREATRSYFDHSCFTNIKNLDIFYPFDNQKDDPDYVYDGEDPLNEDIENSEEDELLFLDQFKSKEEFIKNIDKFDHLDLNIVNNYYEYPPNEDEIDIEMEVDYDDLQTLTDIHSCYDKVPIKSTYDLYCKELNLDQNNIEATKRRADVLNNIINENGGGAMTIVQELFTKRLGEYKIETVENNVSKKPPATTASMFKKKIPKKRKWQIETKKPSTSSSAMSSSSSVAKRIKKNKTQPQPPSSSSLLSSSSVATAPIPITAAVTTSTIATAREKAVEHEKQHQRQEKTTISMPMLNRDEDVVENAAADVTTTTAIAVVDCNDYVAATATTTTNNNDDGGGGVDASKNPKVVASNELKKFNPNQSQQIEQSVYNSDVDSDSEHYNKPKIPLYEHNENKQKNFSNQCQELLLNGKFYLPFSLPVSDKKITTTSSSNDDEKLGKNGKKNEPRAARITCVFCNSSSTSLGVNICNKVAMPGCAKCVHALVWDYSKSYDKRRFDHDDILKRAYNNLKPPLAFFIEKSKRYYIDSKDSNDINKCFYNRLLNNNNNRMLFSTYLKSLKKQHKKHNIDMP